jgi:hypothetical protein
MGAATAPNISHILPAGEFRVPGYKNSGLLDSTHVRFYFVRVLSTSYQQHFLRTSTLFSETDKTEFSG